MSAAVDYDRERAEFLAEALGEFAAFCGLLEIVPKEGTGRQPFVLNHIQRLFNIARTGRDIVLKPRQIGFSTVELARDVWHFITVPGASVLIVCQSAGDDGPLNEIASKVADYFASLERAGLQLHFVVNKAHDWHIVGADGTRAKLAIRTAGASEASAKKLGRSGTVTRLHCTETSVWEYAELSMNAVLECVPKRETGSEIVIESTPHGAAGFFHRYCMAALKNALNYKLHFYPWFYHPEYAISLDDGESIMPANDRETSLLSFGCTPEQLKWYRRKVEEKKQSLVDQEYPSDPVTCFLVSGRSFFDKDAQAKLIDKTKTTQPIELRDKNRIRIYERPIPGKVYIMGVDTSSGSGEDASAAILLERDSGAHVATIDGQYPTHELARACAKLGMEYNKSFIAVERNNHGNAVLLEIGPEHIGYPYVHVHTDLQPGWLTDKVSRPVMLDELEDVHRRGLWGTPDQNLLAQMGVFVVWPDGRPRAQPGALDDLVMAAAIAWAVRSMPLPDLSVGGVTKRARFRGGGTRGHRL